MHCLKQHCEFQCPDQWTELELPPYPCFPQMNIRKDSSASSSKEGVERFSGKERFRLGGAPKLAIGFPSEKPLLTLFCLLSSTHNCVQCQRMPNSSSVSEFLLLAFADTRELQLLHFVLFLGIYLAALLGNGLILSAVACDHRLHTPMYFFLLNLALLDLGCISTTLPKAMANALWDTRAISYQGCAAQVFLFVLLMSSEYFLLTIMPQCPPT
uniref:G-protein coupled receptors family 1 profile domain-containing protein n=1 Tax=Anas platyrhynchos platyrhynchos TaxID=8840 RepID=A0A493SUT1_ANAPP